MLWPPDAMNWLIEKDLDAGKDWRQEENDTTVNGMIGWQHWLSGHVFEQAPGVGGEQQNLAFCSPCGRKELDMNEWMNWTELIKPQLTKKYSKREKKEKGNYLKTHKVMDKVVIVVVIIDYPSIIIPNINHLHSSSKIKLVLEWIKYIQFYAVYKELTYVLRMHINWK